MLRSRWSRSCRQVPGLRRLRRLRRRRSVHQRRREASRRHRLRCASARDQRAAARRRRGRGARGSRSFLGSTLRELCDSYGALAAAASTPPSVWAEVLATLREREETKTSWTLDPATARHMKYRATLIEWILEVCADFGFGPTTADLAVQYMVRTRSRPIFLHPADPVAARRRRVESRDPPRTPWVASPRSHLTIASPDVPAGSRPEQGERAQDLAPAGGDVLSGSCR